MCLLGNPMDYTVHGILQARILEWVAFPFSRGTSQPRDRTQVSCTVGRCFIGKFPWRRERLPTLVFWPRELYGLYSPWGHKESDTKKGELQVFYI